MLSGAPSAPRIAIYVVGDVMLDVVVQVQSPFSHASDTPSVISTSPGGAAANQCVAMARAGAIVSLVGVVGNDPFGDAAVRALRAAGVDVGLLAHTDRSTGVVVALVEPDGQRSMLTDRGANLALDVATVQALATHLASRASHLHVSGYCLLDDASRPAGRLALALARQCGATASVDASSAGPLRAVGADRFKEWVTGVDYLFCNEDEGKILTACTEPEAIAQHLLACAAEVVVTLGAAGALVATRRGELLCTAATAASVTDTIGAGDGFTATYLTRRLDGIEPAESLVEAVEAARHAVVRRGARDWKLDYSRK